MEVFKYITARETVLRILSNKQLSTDLLLDYDSLAAARNEYSELNTGKYWLEALNYARRKTGRGDIRILPVIVSSDDASVDSKKSVKPMYLTLGIHKLEVFLINYVTEHLIGSSRYQSS